jgi:hypothetical protein
MPDLKLPSEIKTTGGRLRAAIRTLDEALRLIDDLPPEHRQMPRWTFARDLSLHAAKTGKKRDIFTAARQLTQALSNEGWLAEAAGPEKSGEND